MDEMVGQPAKAGIHDVVAEKNVGIIQSFLGSKGPAENIQALTDRISGAKAALAASNGGNGLCEQPGSWALVAA
jgi:hypothetical protein